MLECLFVYQREGARQVETGNDLSRLSPACPGHNNGTHSRLSAPSQKSQLPLSFLSAEPPSVTVIEDRCGSEGFIPLRTEGLLANGGVAGLFLTLCGP